MLLLADLLVSCLHTEEKITNFILVGSRSEKDVGTVAQRAHHKYKNYKTNAKHQHQSNISFTLGLQTIEVWTNSSFCIFTTTRSVSHDPE